jgi:acetyl-CoA C-acetyltransferase
MRPVYIAGTGMTAVAEHWTRTALSLASDAARQAMGRTTSTHIDALYVANGSSATLGLHQNFAPAVAHELELDGIEAISFESAGAAGGLAIRQAALAVAAGLADAILVVGVEKVSDFLDEHREESLALTSDTDWESLHGVTLTAQWAMLMRKYMHEYAVDISDFAPFPVNAHANAVANKQALYRFAISADKLKGASMIADPLSLLDSSTIADGAAAVIISATPAFDGPTVRIIGSGVASAPVALHDRDDLLDLTAIRQSSQRALSAAGIDASQVQAFDLYDPHGIAAVLAFEAMGYAAKGTGTQLGASNAIRTDGSVPLALTGGCKARGDVFGALGVYQIAELTAQLRHSAPNQVPNCQFALAQSMAGIATTVVTHILARD